MVLAASGCGADGPSVSFVSPRDGAVTQAPVRVEMATDGIRIVRAGPVAPESGHFHVMVDVGCVKEGTVIPVAANGYWHFGHAERVGELPLEPGRHTLCLQVGDGVHVARGETDVVTITVR
ncbi:MAG TPA: DUF4399 domain-containing protein [Acidimicrobiales bacterium]|nr:DUF4399 domain-containing protein [Acidimicrobiales bacterium]